MNDYKWLDKILEVIFPRNVVCLYCGDEIEKNDKYSLCEGCYERMDFVSLYEKRCIICNRPISKNSPYDKCRDCLQEYRYFDLLIPAVVYGDLAKHLLHDLKYHDKRYLSYHFAHMINDMEIPSGVFDFDFIVPVPSSVKKKRSRGYNQAEILAKSISESLKLDIISDLLIKIDTGLDQNQLGKKDRKKNIEGAIEFNYKYASAENKSIILVDDIFTTGATVNECSKILKENGAKRVVVMVSAIASLE